jgi:hypothetical protein
MVPAEMYNLPSSTEFLQNFNHVNGSPLETPGVSPRRMTFSDSPKIAFALADPDGREEWDALWALYEENQCQILRLTKINIQLGDPVCRIVNTVPESHSSELLRLYLKHFELVESLLELSVPSSESGEIERNGSITDGPGQADGRS